jgi:hypothetical protein
VSDTVFDYCNRFRTTDRRRHCSRIDLSLALHRLAFVPQDTWETPNYIINVIGYSTLRDGASAASLINRINRTLKFSLQQPKARASNFGVAMKGI